MAVRMFEGKKQAASYQKYRQSPPEEVQKVVLSYLEKKKGKPFQLAVDIGCGTGLSTRVLAPYFQRVVGTDISEAQIEEAWKVPGFTNVSYSICPAEKLPFEDNSVDLVNAVSAAHWFNMKKFMAEVDRVLKPKGCLALQNYRLQFELHYGDCTRTLSQIFQEVHDSLEEHAAENFKLIRREYKDIFDAITYPDKERVDDILVKLPMTISGAVGLLSTFSMYQSFLKKDPEAAEDLLRRTEQRFLEVLGVSSSETELEMRLRYFCLLACKPA